MIVLQKGYRLKAGMRRPLSGTTGSGGKNPVARNVSCPIFYNFMEEITETTMKLLFCCAVFVGTLAFTGLHGASAPTRYNLDFEHTDGLDRLTRWEYIDQYAEEYASRRDTLCRYRGRSSLRLERSDSASRVPVCFYQTLPDSLVAGHEVELSGWTRTEEHSTACVDLLLALPEELEGCQWPSDGSQLTDGADRKGRGKSGWHRIKLRRQLPDSVAGLCIGGMLTGSGIAWFDDFELRIDGRKLRDTAIPELKYRLTPREKRELRRYIYPLRGYDPADADSVELRLLDRLVGAGTVVALGENSHGASEIFRLKERIIRYLNRQLGFNRVVFEAEMAEGTVLNGYICSGVGHAKAGIFGLDMWVWDVNEVVSLVEWMRLRNIEDHRIEFSGVDMQSTAKARELLRQRLKENPAALKLLDRMAPKLDKVLRYDEQGMARIDPQLAGEITQELDSLETRIDALASGLCQCITLIRQYLRQGHDLFWRDRCMAENLLWLRRQHPDERMVLWAHNGHISRADKRMGYWLDRQLGADCVTFGFTFYDGRYTIIKPGVRTRQHDAQEAYPGTLEYLLRQLDEPLFILDLKRMREEHAPALKWLRQMKYRHVGVVKLEDELPGHSRPVRLPRIHRPGNTDGAVHGISMNPGRGPAPNPFRLIISCSLYPTSISCWVSSWPSSALRRCSGSPTGRAANCAT